MFKPGDKVLTLTFEVGRIGIVIDNRNHPEYTVVKFLKDDKSYSLGYYIHKLAPRCLRLIKPIKIKRKQK